MSKPNLIPVAAAVVLLAALHGQAVAQAADAAKAASNTRQVITRADQLPRRSITLAMLPSAYLQAPLDEARKLQRRGWPLVFNKQPFVREIAAHMDILVMSGELGQAAQAISSAIGLLGA